MKTLYQLIKTEDLSLLEKEIEERTYFIDSLIEDLLTIKNDKAISNTYKTIRKHAEERRELKKILPVVVKASSLLTNC